MAGYEAGNLMRIRRPSRECGEGGALRLLIPFDAILTDGVAWPSLNIQLAAAAAAHFGTPCGNEADSRSSTPMMAQVLGVTVRACLGPSLSVRSF
jgi:hypothetical protein